MRVRRSGCPAPVSCLAPGEEGAVDTERVECKTPTPGKKSTNIERWKYDRISEAIIALVPRDGDGLPFRQLPGLVAEYLGADMMMEIGSASWYTTTVKLDLEVKGILYRHTGPGGQRLLSRV